MSFYCIKKNALIKFFLLTVKELLMFKHKEGNTYTPLRVIIFFIIPISFCISFASLGVDMFGWFKKDDLLLSTTVKGQLSEEGNVLSGITVYRELTYGKEYKDTAITDENGYFSFPEKIIQTNKPSNMLDNDSIRQSIYINVQNEQIFLWAVRLYTTTPSDSALSRNLINLTCDINSQAKTRDISSEEDSTELLAIHGICDIK